MQHSNRLFKAKRIRDNLVLSDVVDVKQSSIQVLKDLDATEVIWSSDQHEKKIEWLKYQLQKKVRANDLVDQLLVKCKQHGGPVTSANELMTLVNEKPAKLKMILRAEIQYQRVMHQQDAVARRELYKVNALPEKERIENLTVILGDDNQSSVEPVLFPCEDEIIEMLREGTDKIIQEEATVQVTEVPSEDPAFQFNQPVAVIWDEGCVKRWYIGFYLDDNRDGTFRVDHLMHAGTGD